jgi:Zn2+/Cd2+-exporting ATPase
MIYKSFPAIQEHPDALMAAVCGLLLLTGWLLLSVNPAISLGLLALAYLIGGYNSALEGLTTLWEERELDVDLLMIVAALGAAGLGLWKKDYHLIVDGAVLILIFAISGALEGYALQRTAKSIQGLMSLTPDIACLLDGTKVSIKELKVGDRLLVKPGELIPTDAIISDGQSSINQAAITGESLPVDKTIGDEVFGGTINGNGVLQLTIHQPPASSLIQRIINLVQQAQTENTPSQNFIEKFERLYARVIVISGLLIGTLPALLGWWDWETTIYRALIFLVVASPCALMAAIMPGLLSGIANGAQQGILFKNATTLEAIGQIKAIAFDKTGTLTTGQLQVSEIWYRNEQGEIVSSDPAALDPLALQILTWATAIESGSEHPIGQTIDKLAKAQNMVWPVATNIQAQPGVGITGEIAGQSIAVGKVPPHSQWDIPTDDKITTWVMVNGQVQGAITFQDKLRPEAADLVQRLQKLGIQTVMLTGDNLACAQSIATQIGITEFHADLLPEAKVDVIRQLQSKYQQVAMVGDGINDAPALATANVGIAMGAVGSDVALETADMVLMTDALGKIETAIKLGRRSQRVIQQNIVFALSFIVMLLIGNFAGAVNLPLGVFGHEGSTVLVTLSGLRLLRK